MFGLTFSFGLGLVTATMNWTILNTTPSDGNNLYQFKEACEVMFSRCEPCNPNINTFANFAITFVDLYSTHEIGGKQGRGGGVYGIIPLVRTPGYM